MTVLYGQERMALFPRATSQVAACRHLATAARVKYPAALQRCKFDTPLLAAGSLIHGERKTDFSGWLPLFFLSVIQAVYRHGCLYSITKKACGKKRHTCVAVIFSLRI